MQRLRFRVTTVSAFDNASAKRTRRAKEENEKKKEKEEEEEGRGGWIRGPIREGRRRLERRRSSLMLAVQAKKIRANYTDGGAALAAAGKEIFSGAVAVAVAPRRCNDDNDGRLATV